MKIKILPKVIVENIDSEESLSDQSIMESFYCIRKLKVAAFFGSDTILEVNQNNQYGQVYIDQFDIWLHENEFVIL